LKILILGGTIFVGRHIVEAAISRGHEVTLFNRGKHELDSFSGIERLTGDRDGDLMALRDRDWDVVIDTCGFVPRIVRDSAEMLAPAVDRYIFISSISVYADFSQPNLDENSKLGTLEDPTIEEINGESYGPLKALCETAVEESMPGRVLIIRPGLIVGPHDPTDRFTYWPHRLAQGGEVLVPGDPDRQVQFIDARDLALWTVLMAERSETGVFHVTGPSEPLTFVNMLERCKQAVDSPARLSWVTEKYLIDEKVEPWMELPLWISGPEANGLMKVDIGKALTAGLSFRPLEETARDTVAWAKTRPADHEWKAGLDPQKESDLLSNWHDLG